VDVNDDSHLVGRGLEPLLTLEQAARYLNVSKASLRRWTNDGRLACHRVGARGERRFARSDLDAHLELARRERGRGSRPDATSAVAADGVVPAGQVPHVSAFFRDEDELWALVRPYLLQHVRAGLPILYICDSLTVDTFRERLRREGHDPAPLEATGYLRLLTADQAYLRTGAFSADGMIAFMESAIVELRAAGHLALMLSGEMTWFFSGAPGVDGMWEYETRLNDLMRRYPGVTTVCSYDLRRFDGVAVVEALCSHPFARLPDRQVRGFYG
jgi:excisionase family DNA binding protein